jgi:catechol 2,3-dioxygenase-like lactoylglutathione lyase family enzyme
VETREHARMKVNHLHLMVPDVRASAEFFEKYFDLRNASGNAGLAVLLDDDGFVLTLMKAGSKTTKGYPENFHVGFFVADEARVDEIHGRMQGDGLDVAPPARNHAYSFYVGAPGGFLVEVGA